jgi:hypothetical protein
MADCSGYGFGATIQLCVSGPVGNGNKANLQISFDNTGNFNFDESEVITVSNWDGKEVVADITPALVTFSAGYSSSNCTVTAQVTVTPTKDNMGTILVEFMFTDCGPTAQTYNAEVFENCGGVGPHTISEMSTFTLDGLACM